MTTRRPTTHELYLHAVRDLVIARSREQNTITADQAARLTHTKLLSGVGDGTYRGCTEPAPYAWSGRGSDRWWLLLCTGRIPHW